MACFASQGLGVPKRAASKDAAPRAQSPCAPNDGAEWRRSTSDSGLNCPGSGNQGRRQPGRQPDTHRIRQAILAHKERLLAVFSSACGVLPGELPHAGLLPRSGTRFGRTSTVTHPCEAILFAGSCFRWVTVFLLMAATHVDSTPGGHVRHLHLSVWIVPMPRWWWQACQRSRAGRTASPNV